MRTLCAVSLVLLSAACGGAADTSVKPLLSDIQAKIFNNSCTFSSCHSEAGHKGSLVLTQGKSRAALVGILAANTEAKRLGKKRVVAGDPDNSFFFQKVNRAGAKFCTAAQLENDDQTCEGEQMPGMNDRMPQDRIDTLRQWIAAGALDN